MEKMVMITLIYTIKLEDKDTELEWLKDQKIFPACSDAYDWTTGTNCIKIGVIVAPAAALVIKLRHKLDLQTDYKQR
jgi:hypothetical protein